MNDLFSFDTSKSVWTQHNAVACPEERSFHSMASDGTQHIYIFGGCGAKGRLNDLFVYDTFTGRWKQLIGTSHIQVDFGDAHR